MSNLAYWPNNLLKYKGNKQGAEQIWYLADKSTVLLTVFFAMRTSRTQKTVK